MQTQASSAPESVASAEHRFAVRDLRFGRYGFFAFTFAFLLISMLGHWVFGWFAYIAEQQQHGAAISVSEFSFQILRDTFENWQSEFLQLIWQVAGLAFLLHIGSPQSKEGDDRKEAKLDAILEAVDPTHGRSLIERLDQQFRRS
ncbi:MAG: DUF6766 family protein [Parvibaculaceae bacterium]